MTLLRTIVALCTRGVVAGGALGLMVPVKQASAGCKCDDTGPGKYACNWAQTECVAGNEWCQVYCS